MERQSDYKLLVVDDDPFVRDMLRAILESSGYAAETAADGASALALYQEAPKPDLILSDMNMPEMNGLELVKALRRRDAETPFLILTSNTEIKVALEAIRSGADDYLLKDENIDETVLIAVKRALDKYRLEQENRRLITDLAGKKEDLEKSNKELLELNELKNKFMRIAAHDLRGPISGVIGMTDILMKELDDASNDAQIKRLRLMKTTLNQMLNLLNELLDISIIESGRLELDIVKCDIRRLLIDRIRINMVIADKKNISLHADLGKTGAVYIDPKRIIQVFDNLMGNAIKFSPPDTSISIILQQDGDRVTVSVRDQGPGLSEEDQSRLFREFERLSSKPTAGETSTGLGLSICKKIIDAHDGTIVVESRPGEGATFRFSLPMKPADAGGAET
jgi:signal transduction histidine kinase